MIHEFMGHKAIIWEIWHLGSDSWNANMSVVLFINWFSTKNMPHFEFIKYCTYVLTNKSRTKLCADYYVRKAWITISYINNIMFYTKLVVIFCKLFSSSIHFSPYRLIFILYATLVEFDISWLAPKMLRDFPL